MKMVRGMVEQLGSGVPRILQTYNEGCFYFSDNYIRMSFPAEQVTEQDTEKEKTVGKTTLDKIIELLENNPMITRTILAETLQLSVRGIEYQLKKLKDARVIDRKGSRKDVYWIVINKEN